MKANSAKTRAGLMLAATIGAAVLGGCGGGGSAAAANSLPDGSYSGQSDPEGDGSYGVVSFTVSAGSISDASFVMYDDDGTPHDEAYGLGSDGKPADEAFYQRAQNAIKAEQNYITQFEEVGDQNEVESIAGASLSYRVFLNAVAVAIDNGAK
ncbi:MAG: FMN-binding protein [Ancrocorticia sp.]